MTATQLLDQYDNRGWNDNTKLHLLLGFLDQASKDSEAVCESLQEYLDEAVEIEDSAVGDIDNEEDLARLTGHYVPDLP